MSTPAHTITLAHGCFTSDGSTSILEAALAQSFTPEAAAGVAVDASELNGDLHGSAAYRANLISVMAQRAVAKALA